MMSSEEAISNFMMGNERAILVISEGCFGSHQGVFQHFLLICWCLLQVMLGLDRNPSSPLSRPMRSLLGQQKIMDSDNSEPYSLNIKSITQHIDQHNWQDLQGSKDSQLPENAFFTVVPPQQYAKYYAYFRALLNTEEVSQRGYALTTLMLKLKTTNYYALMLRSKYYFSRLHMINELIEEIHFINCLLNENPKEYQVWTYKKKLFAEYRESITAREDIYKSEVDFMDYLFSEDSKNYHVWDFKLWLTVYYSKEEEELLNSELKIFKKNEQVEQLKDQLESLSLKVEEVDWKNCYSLWSFRYNLRMAHNSKLSIEQQNKEEQRQVGLMREWMSNEANLTNQCGWNYLTGLLIELKSLSKELLLEFSEIALVTFLQNDNRFAGNAYLQFSQVLEDKYQEKVDKSEVIQGLKASDKVRELYYQYLLQG